MDVGEAQALAQNLWNVIQTRRHSSGTDSKFGQADGIHGMLDYYRGNHNLRFASEQFRESWNKRYVGFNDNWCAPVVDAAAERINHVGIRLGADTQTEDLEFQRIMDANDAERGFSELVTVTLASSRAYSLVWGNRDDDTTPLITWEHPEFCAVARDPETRRITASAKGWFEADNKGCLTLYTDDEVWKWNWEIAATKDARQTYIWSPRQGKDNTWPMKNPLGRNPMTEFTNTSLLDDKPLSDIAGVAAMQDAVNLVWGYLFNALDFASLPQRVVLGNDIPEVPILDAAGQVVGSRKVTMKELKEDRLLWLPNADATIGSWPAAQLDVFNSVIEMAVDHISAQTRTPGHYLIGKMSNVAGDAFTASETGLVARCIQDQKNFTAPTRNMYGLIALAQGSGNKALAQQAARGTILWADPQYRALSQKVDAFLKFRQAGMPIEWLLEWYGQVPSEVARIMAMIEKEDAQAVKLAAANAAFVSPPGSAPLGILPPELA